MAISLHSLVETKVEGAESANVIAQAFVTASGRKLLIANKRDHAIDLPLPDAEKTSALTVDVQSGDGPARTVKTSNGKLRLEPFAVTVVSW